MKADTDSQLKHLDELIQKHEKLNREALADARAEHTNRFGWVDEIAMNEAWALYQLGKERVSLRSLEFDDDAVMRKLMELATVNTIEAKLNGRWIARSIRRIEIMAFAIFIIVVGQYISNIL